MLKVLDIFLIEIALLAALRRSKKRVRAVITTELPLLMSREFSSNLEKDAYITTGSTVCHLDQATADAHSVRWNTLFAQMDKALSEEENHLVRVASSLNRRIMHRVLHMHTHV